MEKESRDLNHFLDLVLQGKRKGCSSGEHKARLLAKAILKHSPGLDDSALNGAREYMNIVIWKPNQARELIG